MANEQISVEVVYAVKDQQWIMPVLLSSQSTVKEAIDASKILDQCPEIDLHKNKVGIFGVIVELTHVLSQGDRVEIYRPLAIDTITRRFQRVAKSRRK